MTPSGLNQITSMNCPLESRPFLNQGALVNGLMEDGVSVVSPFSFRPHHAQTLFNNTGGVARRSGLTCFLGIDPHWQALQPSSGFNPSAIDQPFDFTLGDAPRTEPDLRNPGARNFDSQ